MYYCHLKHSFIYISTSRRKRLGRSAHDMSKKARKLRGLKYVMLLMMIMVMIMMMVVVMRVRVYYFNFKLFSSQGQIIQQKEACRKGSDEENVSYLLISIIHSLQ